MQPGYHPSVVLYHPRVMSQDLSGKAEYVPTVRAALNPGSKAFIVCVGGRREGPTTSAPATAASASAATAAPS